MPRLKNWTDAQEAAFQKCLAGHRRDDNAVPKLLINPMRKGMRDRGWTPARIAKHRGLLPC